MSSREWLIAGAVLVACCCCCSNRNQQPDPSPQSQTSIAAFAFAPETELERAKANAYPERVLAALRRELPSLSVLDTGVQDWCEPDDCHLGVDYFFGLDGELLPALESINKVLRRDSTHVLAGIESVRSVPPACSELRYELRAPEGTTSIDPRWVSAVHWIDTTGTACARDIPPVLSIGSSSFYRVRDKDVDVSALGAGVLGRHRYVVHVGIGGPYGGRNS